MVLRMRRKNVKKFICIITIITIIYIWLPELTFLSNSNCFFLRIVSKIMYFSYKGLQRYILTHIVFVITVLQVVQTCGAVEQICVSFDIFYKEFNLSILPNFHALKKSKKYQLSHVLNTVLNLVSLQILTNPRPVFLFISLLTINY